MHKGCSWKLSVALLAKSKPTLNFTRDLNFWSKDSSNASNADTAPFRSYWRTVQRWFRDGSKRLGIKMCRPNGGTFCRTMVMKSNPKRAERKRFACVFRLDHKFATVKKNMFFSWKSLIKPQSYSIPGSAQRQLGWKIPGGFNEKIICGSSAIARFTGGEFELPCLPTKDLHGFVWKWGILSII